MKRYLRSALNHRMLLLLVPATMHAVPPTVGVEIDIAAQREGTTIVRTLDIHQPTELAFVVIGIRQGDAYDVAMQVDGVEMPSMSIAAASLGAAQSAPGTVAGISSGIRSMSDSVRGGGASQGGLPFNSAAADDDWRPDSTAGTVSYRLPGTSLLRPGQRMTVTVRRRAIAGDRVWTTILTTPPRGAWRISFGFAFALMVNPDHEYTTRRDTGNAYAIHRVADPPVITSAPVFMLHWLADDDQWEDWSWSVTAGLGLDVTDPIVLLGGALTFNQNITMAAGATAQKLKRLNPRYTEGARVAEDLAPEQLHRRVYGVNPFVALSFRFADNLFGK